MTGPLIKGCIPTRAVIGLMLFSACFIAYSLRVNMSINLIAMVESSGKGNQSDSLPECRRIVNPNDNESESYHKQTGQPDYGPRYDWDTKLQGLILGSFFWGFMVTCIPGGLLAEKFGPTKVIMIASLLAGALTILSPLMASMHYSALIVSRFLIGLTGGVIYPSLHCLVSRWAPPEEKGKFIGSLMGGTLGTVVTWPVLGSIIETWGWNWSFFINGGVVLLWCVLWILLVSDSPDVHPRISEEEKLYITKSLEKVIKKPRGLPPYRRIFMSLPFWALIILHFGNLWGLFFLMTAGPNYFSTVLGFDLGHTGFLASLPHLARLIFGFFFGLLGDFIRRRGIVSTNVVRKSFVLFSHLIPGVLLLFLNIVGCDVNWSVALMTMSLGSNGASTLTNLQNSQDLAPNFAGSLYGIINCIGSTTGFVTPLIVGALTQEKNGLEEWHIIFAIGAAVYVVCGLVFCIFGSADIQPWNDPEFDSDKDGLDNPAFETASEITVKVSDLEVENTKI